MWSSCVMCHLQRQPYDFDASPDAARPVPLLQWCKVKSKQGEKLQKAGKEYYHRWLNWNNSGVTDCWWSPHKALHLSNICLWSERCSLEHKSATLLSTPAICWALISNSCKAARKQISLKHSCKNSSLEAPEFSTCTYVMLSHSTRILMPLQVAPHSLQATTMASNSRELIHNERTIIKSGNWEWKYWHSTQAPQPSRHASLDTTASGSHQSSQGIIDHFYLWIKIRARDPFPWRSIHQNLTSLGNSFCSDSNLAGASL